ncbi:hypothetical protein ACI782_00585 [Geodermatophilus sp. SYSU D00703]
MSVPTPQSAAALLAEAEAADARVARAAGAAPSGFLTTLGFASAGFFLAQPMADGDRAVLATAVVFVPAVLGAALALLTGLQATRHGFSQRFGLAMGAWGAVLAVGLAVGLAPGAGRSWVFWAPLAVLVAAPCLVGAWRESPR